MSTQKSIIDKYKSAGYKIVKPHNEISVSTLLTAIEFNKKGKYLIVPKNATKIGIAFHHNTNSADDIAELCEIFAETPRLMDYLRDRMIVYEISDDV